ncbi:MAG: transposase [Thermoproteales archaeon]|nr:transposase [Thermoproteales archaeon]
MSEVVLSVAFKYEADARARKLLEDFRDMVNFCIERALEAKVTSYARLRKLVYAEFRARWPGYASHWCHSAVRVATSMLKSWRKRCRRGEADPGRPPRARKLFMRLDDHVARFRGDRVVITVEPRRYLVLRLTLGEYQRRFVEAWRRGELRVGEIVVNEKYVLVPFRKTVDLTNPREWIALDVNETNVTGVSSNPHVYRWDLSDLRRIYWTYHEIRRRIQRIKGRRKRRLLEKYSRRLRNRTRDLLHKISRRIVDTAVKLGAGILMEDLRGIKRKRRRRSLNRRLHNFWPARRLQFYVEYKAKLFGLPVQYLNPRNTSSQCPACGGRLVEAPNGHRLLRCPRCGLEGDRDVIACLNLLKMWGVPVPPERLPMILGRGEPLPQTRFDTILNGMKR